MKRKATTAGLGSYQKRQQRRRTSSNRVLMYQRPTSDVKATDTILTATGITAGGVVYNLWNSLAQGTSYLNNFIGQKINPIGVDLRISWTVGDPTNICRHIIFQLGDNNVVPIPGYVIQSLNALSPKNLDNRPELNILSDKMVGLRIYATGGADVTVDHIYIKGKKLLQASYAASTNRWKNQLYILLISDSAIVTNPSVTFFCRTYFTDM